MMDKEDVLLAEMLESWKDIRSFGTSIWQITGLSLAAIGLVIGQALGGTFNGEPILTTFIGWLLLLFAYLVSLFALKAINWLVGAVISRADMIHQMERRLQGFDVNLYTDYIEEDSKGVYGFGFIIIFEWKGLPSLLGALFGTIGGTAILALQIVGSEFVTTLGFLILNFIFCTILILILGYTGGHTARLRKRYSDRIIPREYAEYAKPLEKEEEAKKPEKGEASSSEKKIDDSSKSL
jgi:hypothetical protein